MRTIKRRPDGTPYRILIVENDPGLRQALVRLLLHDGFDALPIASASEVGRSTPVDDYDTLLFDEESEPGEFHELIRELRSSGFNGPIISMTEMREGIANAAAGEAGVTDTLRKPLSVDALRSTLGRVAGPEYHAELPRASAHRRTDASNLFLAILLILVLSGALVATTLLLFP